MLAAGCVAPTSSLWEIGTPLAAQGTAIAITQTAEVGNTFTLEPAPTPSPVVLTSATPTRQAEATEASTPSVAGAHDTKAQPSDTPVPGGASVTVAVDLNVRTGPGTNYDAIGWLAAGTTVAIVGRSADGNWWQIPYPGASGGVAWISEGYGTPRNIQDVPVVVAPPTPTPSLPTVTPTPSLPTATPTSGAPPTPPPLPAAGYQYTPTGWWGDTNYGLTRFLGEIRDAAGNPVNGVFVRATCGDYATISYPSGPVGWGSVGESSDWPPGFYDITVDSKPVPCMWTLQVVATDDRQTVKAQLSEAVPVEVTHEQSIIQANWQKNW
jgi:uncharacterized protein YraI